MFRKLIFLTVLICCLKVDTYANFDFNPNCVQAYKAIVSLRLTEARRIINREKAIHPQNSITALLDNYYDFYYLLTTENKVEFDKLIQNKSARIDLLDKDDERSPYHNFAMAQVYLQWAFMQSRYGEFTSAGFGINKAYRLLQENAKKFPSFTPNNIPLGVINVLLGSLPGGALKSVLGFFGIKGNTQTGISMLESLSNTIKDTPYSYHYDELVFYYTYILTNVTNDPNAFSKTVNLTAAQDNQSEFKAYIIAYVGMKTGHSNEVISLLDKRVQDTDSQPYPALDYIMAIAKMNRGDNDANNYFNKFIQEYKGVNYIKDAYLHLAWQCLLDSDIRRYNAFIVLVRSKGYLYNDKDKQALDEANDDPANVLLLRARLLCDGGYYNKALAVLANHGAGDFKLQRDKIEYYYRIGRIYDSMDNDDEALKFYTSAINIGKTSTYHYAASSAIRMGMIYEQKKDFTRARNAYQMISNFGTKQFKNSLEQKAKDGLNRISGK
ncbi:tetratricopeptide repeat protein [Mucilaginibacter sp. HMF5004]|uniref:tetratricopeptide repeat protein n=1 Tax=Mucilaginibacter rivuli TaxID=2857527 RepID=UPI001C5E1F80|nr:tetratricopeptide repeat protein [Mucilaginibacter rivuli]MBW4890384.1 tetratricopeptide repeat protein [Mucilaginibacter rivuli]